MSSSREGDSHVEAPTCTQYLHQTGEHLRVGGEGPDEARDGVCPVEDRGACRGFEWFGADIHLMGITTLCDTQKILIYILVRHLR